MYWQGVFCVTLCTVIGAIGCSNSQSHPVTGSGNDNLGLECNDPAPLEGGPEPAELSDYFVCFHERVDVPAEAARLAEKYGFVPKYVYTSIPCMAVRDLPGETVESLRCESTVARISYQGELILN